MSRRFLSFLAHILVEPDLRAGRPTVSTTLGRLRFSRVCLVLFAGLFSATAHAQSVRWEPNRGSLAVGQTTELQLVFEDCTPDNNVRVPRVDGLTLEPLGRSTSTSIINFTRSDSVTITYGALLTKKQTVTIPAFEVTTNKGQLRTPVAVFEAGDATIGSTGVALENAASSRLVAAPATVWAGEVFALNYTLEAAHSYTPDFGRGLFEWNPEPLVAEEWSRPEPFSAGAGGSARDGLSYRTRAIARASGSIRLNAVRQLLNLGVGVTGFGFFQQRQYQQFSITSTAPLLEIKPLPSAPAGFTGAVGSLKLNSKVVPTTAAIGEPITWTLELSGTANWPDVVGLPPRNVSKDFQVVSPQAKRTNAEGKLFEATLVEDVVLVPTKPGTYNLGPYTFAYFDPKLGAYQTITTPATSITITPAAVATTTVTPASTAASTDEPKPQRPTAKAPPPPAALPRDPLAGSEIAPLPLATVRLWLLLVAPIAPLLLYWGGLALRRARSTDPLRDRREAYARLEKLLAELRAGTPANPSHLLQWQHDLSRLLQLPHAAPTPSLIDAQLKSQNSKFKTLWAESDQALYGESTPLPADWPARAQSALAETPVARFSPLRLFRPQNLFPFLAIVLLFALVAPPARAADGSASEAAAYRSGDFPAAEKSWRAALVAAPTDAIARHNLSLALAQQDRWDEAAAHAAAALVQFPASEPIRAQFALAAEKSGHVPPPLAAFLTPGPLESLARLASPTRWQYTLCAAALLGAVALALLLRRAYATGAKALWPAVALLACSVAVALAAFFSWHAYGAAADTRAVIVWRAGALRSIPTEADTSQKTSPLFAGSLALADKTFLGWQHLTFGGGQAGWVRKDEVVPLWR